MIDEAQHYVVGIVGPFDSADDAQDAIAARAADDSYGPVVAVQVMSGMALLITALQAAS